MCVLWARDRERMLQNKKIGTLLNQYSDFSSYFTHLCTHAHTHIHTHSHTHTHTHTQGQEYPLHPSMGYKSSHEIGTMWPEATYGEGQNLSNCDDTMLMWPLVLPGACHPGAVCPSLWGPAGYSCRARSQDGEREVCWWSLHHNSGGLHQRQWPCHSGGHLSSSGSELLQDVWDCDWGPWHAAEAVRVSELMGTDYQNDRCHDNGSRGQQRLGAASTSGQCTGNYF